MPIHKRHSSLIATALLASSLSAGASAGCLDFVDLVTLDTHTCFRGAFTCLGNVDENCHTGENQFMLDVVDNGRDPRSGLQQVRLKLENEGMQTSMIESIWVEDDYNLLNGYFEPNPVSNEGLAKFKVSDEENSFNAASAHGVDFYSHFVISETDLGNKLRRHVDEAESDGVWNSGKTHRSESVSMNFETQCTSQEISEAIEYGIIRVGIQASHFEHKPKNKAFVSCFERLNILYTEENETAEN